MNPTPEIIIHDISYKEFLELIPAGFTYDKNDYYVRYHDVFACNVEYRNSAIHLPVYSCLRSLVFAEMLVAQIPEHKITRINIAYADTLRCNIGIRDFTHIRLHTW